jgi:hypothetical protein
MFYHLPADGIEFRRAKASNSLFIEFNCPIVEFNGLETLGSSKLPRSSQ